MDFGTDLASRYHRYEVEVTAHDAILTVRRAERHDAGFYRVTLRDVTSNATCSAETRVSVQTLPRITLAHRMRTDGVAVTCGEDVSVKVPFTANPPPEVSAARSKLASF